MPFEIVPPANKHGAYTFRGPAAYAPDRLHWTYVAENPAGFFAEAISGAQRLPNDNTLICDGTSGVLFEVTPAGETVWKYVNRWCVPAYCRRMRLPAWITEDTNAAPCSRSRATRRITRAWRVTT